MPDPSFFTRRTLLTGVAAAAGSTPAVAASAGSIAAVLNRSFIWSTASGPAHNRFTAFRYTLDIPAGAADAMLHLFADTRYVAWLNGHHLGSGPARFDPRFPE